MLRSATETLGLIDFRVADEGDVPLLVHLYRLFFEDSTLPKLGLTFDVERTEAWLERVIDTGHPTHLIAVERSTGDIVGSLAYGIDHVTAEPYAYLDKFYVLRAWHFSAVGRTLLSSAIEMARGDGAVAFRAGLSSGVSGSRNVFDRLGFFEVPSSVLMERKL